ncbi:PASTA domain-containing protein [Dactylosporangium sp. CA-233914]|uniref:PASTA domain-containing protein n=1 Tax=Dactylosporangium sp. CA-233914 TaxID=3239934 RepID=UPI003D8A373C
MVNRAGDPSDESSTQPFWPFAGGDAVEEEQDADATQVHPRAADETRAQRPIDATGVQPPVEERERWSARAGVPAPGDPGLRRPAPQEWVDEEEDPYQGRSWFTPVIVGIVALVLVAALSFGLYLIYRATENGQNAPGGVESTAATASPLPPPASSEAPSSAAPSSEAPPSSSAPAPAPVVIPPLRGDSLAEATVKLQVLGLNVKVERRADDSLPPGEVLASEPGEGETVDPGDTVTLIVAAAAPSTVPSSPGPSASAAG